MSVWWFFILGCGAIGFTIKILLDHIKEADDISDKTHLAKGQIVTFEEKQEAEERETGELKADLDQLQKDIDSKKGMVSKLQKHIDKRKSDLANQGKFKLND
ncbi:TPA: hypothetical protein DCE37_20185 [Candidatus Latescibacteria bacterium]|nr:hypothetical protein [Candidatus Latescibacterota bacterium]